MLSTKYQSWRIKERAQERARGELKLHFELHIVLIGWKFWNLCCCPIFQSFRVLGVSSCFDHIQVVI